MPKSSFISVNTTANLELIRDFCVKNNATIATAESVTAGAIQFLLSTTTKAQDFFQGGITVYNCPQKAIHLNIDPLFAEKVDGVDIQLTTKMAHEACILFRSQIGVAITGYATPVPEQDIHAPYAFISIVHDGQIIIRQKITTTCKGGEAQMDYADQCIELLAKTLSDNKE